MQKTWRPWSRATAGRKVPSIDAHRRRAGPLSLLRPADDLSVSLRFLNEAALLLIVPILILVVVKPLG